ncbi:MAG: GNAT family N-acetyltransferase, partial [Lachnospiraceae bacterium]|nr:GNAT family N-acetyltransferase [Lachnospiraceae bacterium]
MDFAKLYLREMTINDYDFIFELWANTDGMGLRSLDDSKEGISAFLKRNPSTCFIALDSQKVIGAILCGHDGRRGYIYHTVVSPEYRKQGIGTALVTAATAALKKEGITRVCLNVMDSNESGKLFWINQGWEKKDFLGFYSKSITDRENLPLFN